MHKLKHSRLQENSQPFINSQQKEYTMSILCAMEFLIACYIIIFTAYILQNIVEVTIGNCPQVPAPFKTHVSLFWPFLPTQETAKNCLQLSQTAVTPLACSPQTNCPTVNTYAASPTVSQHALDCPVSKSPLLSAHCTNKPMLPNRCCNPTKLFHGEELPLIQWQ